MKHSWLALATAAVLIAVPLVLSLSPFDVAQGDPEALEGSTSRCSSFDKYILSEPLILRHAQDER